MPEAPSGAVLFSEHDTATDTTRAKAATDPRSRAKTEDPNWRFIVILLVGGYL